MFAFYFIFRFDLVIIYIPNKFKFPAVTFTLELEDNGIVPTFWATGLCLNGGERTPEAFEHLIVLPREVGNILYFKKNLHLEGDGRNVGSKERSLEHIAVLLNYCDLLTCRHVSYTV